MASLDWCRRLFTGNVDCCYTMGDELIKGVGFDRLQGANLRVAHHGPVDCATVRLPIYKNLCSLSKGDDEDDDVSAGFEATSNE